MEIKNFEMQGRKLLVEFKCQRCKKTATRPLEECISECKECYRGLYDLRPPKEWQDGGFYYPLFCPDCAKAHEQFMRGEKVDSVKMVEGFVAGCQGLKNSDEIKKKVEAMKARIGALNNGN